jgi:hypothetical protein
VADTVLDGGRETADNLGLMAAVARDLRAVPVKAMTPPHLDLLRLGTDLQDRLDSVAVQAARLPAAASPHDLRRLAAPALEYAQHAPSLAAPLDLSVREAVAAGLMLVPGTVSWRPEFARHLGHRAHARPCAAGTARDRRARRGAVGSRPAHRSLRPIGRAGAGPACLLRTQLRGAGRRRRPP